MTKKQKLKSFSEHLQSYGWSYCVVLLIAFFVLFTVSKPYCDKYPDKCVCEEKCGDLIGQDIRNIQKELKICMENDWNDDYCLKQRKKTAFELETDYCNENPDDSERCECIEETNPDFVEEEITEINMTMYINQEQHQITQFDKRNKTICRKKTIYDYSCEELKKHLLLNKEIQICISRWIINKWDCNYYNIEQIYNIAIERECEI